MRILIAEDDQKLLGILRRGLEEERYAVETVSNGDDAVWMATEAHFDCVVLDVGLPGRDGFAVCKALRDADVWTPIIMLTARDAVDDRVRGLDVGADDYVTKPFSFEELLARLRALTRRRPGERPTKLEVDDLILDPAAHRVQRAGIPIELTPREYSLLEYLMRHAGEVVSRTRILEHVWDWGYEGGSNVVDVYVRYLRGKVDRPFESPLIHTVRGAGYRIGAP